MKNYITLFFLLITLSAWSQDKASNDFEGSKSEIKPLNFEELAYRFHITGQVFILNTEGDKLINVAGESREWHLGGNIDKPIESNWQFQQKGFTPVNLKQKWKLEKDGKIQVEITQYESMERNNDGEVKFGKIIKEQKFTLKNFSPVEWFVQSGNSKLAIRLTPGVWPKQESINISALPISGKNIVIFSKNGKLWADNVSAEFPSPYFGVTTHQGSLFLSYSQFKGAKMIGEAKAGRIKISNSSGKGSIILQSETPFLPKDVVANVYGVIKPELKTDHINSIRTYSSDKEEEFIKKISEN